MTEVHNNSDNLSSFNNSPLPLLEELQSQFADHSLALQEILRLHRENNLLKCNLSRLQEAYSEISQEYAAVENEKESLQQLREQLQVEARGILQDANVLRIRNEQLRLSRTNSRDENDKDNEPTGRTVAISPCLTPVSSDDNAKENAKKVTPVFFGAASRPLHVSTSTQTDNAPLAAKPYVTMRERMMTRDQQSQPSASTTPRQSLHQSSGDAQNESSVSSHSGLSPRPVNNNNSTIQEEGEETAAFQATTFQDFVRMRREITELRSKVQQQSTAAAASGQYSTNGNSSASTNSTGNTTGRLHYNHTSAGVGGSASANAGKTSFRSVSNHSTTGSNNGTVRMGAVPLAGTHLIESASQAHGISPRNNTNTINNPNHTTLPTVKSSPTTLATPAATSSPAATTAQSKSLFGQFLPKLHA